MNEMTRILSAIEQGDSRAAERLLPLVYDELRRLAAQRLSHEAPGQTLQATALVHETYLRLVGAEDPGWNGRGHFFAAAAEAMRRILIERARRMKSPRRGGDRKRIDLDQARARRGGSLRRPAGPGRGPRSTGDQGCAEGRAGQAPLFCRPDHGTVGGSPGHLARHGAPRLELRTGLVAPVDRGNSLERGKTVRGFRFF